MKNEITLLKQLTRLNPIAERSHRTVIARRVLTLSFLALAGLASMPVRAQDSSHAADSQDQVSPFADHGLEGVWDVTVTIRDSVGNPLTIVSRHEHVYSWRRVRRVWRQKPSRVEGAPVWVFGEPRVAIVTAPCWSFSGLTSMGPSPVPRKSRARSICARGWIVSSRTQQFKYWISMDSWFNPAMRPKQRRGSSRRRGVRESGFGAVPEVSVSSSCSSNPRPYRVTNRFEPQRANWRLLRLSLIWARCRVI
jgi:hypothetical protein